MSERDTTESRYRLGRIISVVGAIWFAVVILAGFGLFDRLPFGGFLRGTLLFPIAMIFAGRALRRRNRPVPVANETSRRPERPEVRRETPRREPPSRSAEPLTFEDLAAAAGFDESASPAKEVDEPRDEPERQQPDGVPDPEVAQPKSSAEMIAEARKKFSSER